VPPAHRPGPRLRPVVVQREEVVFKPIPGQEEEWAEYEGDDRSRLWDWLGTYPILTFIVILLICIASS